MASAENAQLKRQRDDTQIPEFEETKKQKSYNHILSILDDDDEEPTQDLSSLITTLQQELSGTGFDLSDQIPADPEESSPEIAANSEDCSSESSVSNEEDEKERVMRHLLEASDDELGIPTTGGDAAAGQFGGGGDGFVVFDNLWEFEDESASCFTLLESEHYL